MPMVACAGAKATSEQRARAVDPLALRESWDSLPLNLWRPVTGGPVQARRQRADGARVQRHAYHVRGGPDHRRPETGGSPRLSRLRLLRSQTARLVGLAGLATTALLLLSASVASAYVYWADHAGFAIGRSASNGLHVRRNFVPLIATDGIPCGVTVAGRYLYWADELKGAIGRARVDGRGKPNPTFITGASSPCGVAVFRDHLYWADKLVDGSIGRASLTGARDVRQNFVPNERASGGSDLAQPCGLAVGPTGIYWSNAIGGSVGHADLDGTGERTLIDGGLQACGVALSSRYLYWTDQGNGTVGRALLSGATPEPNFVTGLNAPCGAAVASHYLYVADGSTIDRTDLNSSDPTASTEQIVDGLRDGCGVAVR